MLQLYPVYLLWNRRKTLTGSPDPTRMQTVQINLASLIFILFQEQYNFLHEFAQEFINRSRVTTNWTMSR